MFLSNRVLSIILIFGVSSLDAFGFLNFDIRSGKHNVTRDECKNAIYFKDMHVLCCHLKEEDDALWKKCMSYDKTFPIKDTPEDYLYLSALADCIFTPKHYIKSENRLNMKAIRADANKRYHNDSFRKHFMIDMYKECGRRSTIHIDGLKKYPENEEILGIMQKPYFAFILKCIYFYSYIKCPYIRWEGSNESDEQVCAHYATQCTTAY